MLDRCVNYPIWDDDGKSAIKLNSIQKDAIAVFLTKVKNGKYRYINNPCLCGYSKESTDVLLTKKDRFGIPCKNLLCRNCGLIRLKDRLDDESTATFYRDDYRNIYVGLDIATSDFFNSQTQRGVEFYKFISQFVDIQKIKTIFEVGCGAGGIVNAFNHEGRLVSGCDYGEKYLAFGREKGLNLYQGELSSTHTKKGSQDLIILSHVMEHFNNPIQSLTSITEFIKPEGYLFVEVPGIFNIPKTYFNPLMYFQNAHVYNFHYSYLVVLFETIGLEVIIGDEKCSFLLRKPKDWIVKDIQYIQPNLELNANVIEKKIKTYYLLHIFKINPFLYRCLLSGLLRKTGITKFITTLVHR